MFELNYLHRVALNDVPLQWMTRIELFSPDLEQFPLMYVHLKKSNQRIFGFVLSATWGEIKLNGLCDIELQFVCNIPQEKSGKYDEMIKDELCHRIGLADKVEFNDLTTICSKAPESLELLQKIWKDKIETVYGDYVPHGRIFDEVYGIIRFSASGNAPRLGKISEFRMLYWYMKDLGQKVTFGGEVENLKFLEFYLIPTYDELRQENFDLFPNFLSFFLPTKKLWDLEYTKTFSVNKIDFRFGSKDSLPMKGVDFEKRYQKLLGNDYDKISQLRQIFNRMPGRLYSYIWNIMTPIDTDYKKAFSEREIFQEFYRDNSDKKGSSTKVVACFLQQAFGIEAFPIDTWVKTFIYYALGLNPKDNGKGEPSKILQNKLYEKYNRVDKLEKIIWSASMGNKTNKTEFLDILWCQRYGTDGAAKGPCRGANPLSCSQCVLNNVCPGFASIKNEMVTVASNLENLNREMIKHNAFFGILANSDVPRLVYVSKGGKYTLRDSHSGLAISTRTKISNQTKPVESFVNTLK